MPRVEGVRRKHARKALAPTRRLSRPDYPESDGEPMAETPIHWHATVDLAHALHVHYADRADVYVGSDMMMYFERDNANRFLAPDVFVTLGAPKLPERRVWLMWEERDGVPDFVMEITSASTRRQDEVAKAVIYAELGVRDYWQFDPTKDYLDPPLKVRRLGADGRYRPLPLEVHGDVLRQRTVLGLELHLVDGRTLRCFDPRQGVYLPTRAGSEQAYREAERARQEAEQALREAESDLRIARARIAESTRRQRD